ncbi:hypothetical protein VTJ83DRAFT_4127 [Remersonia thermophila]|uniref:CBM1 domain-containing protein n=1 Tax=Remersonia thermophila TaxID=72144 RepID=A0ABR4D9S0_9PEZI
MVRQAALAALALLPLSLGQVTVSEDFEGGWDESSWPTYAPDCNQGGRVSLDTSTAHSGRNSVRVDGAGGYCGHMFFGTKNVPNGDIYVRTWLKASRAFTDAHVTFITMPDPAQGTNKHLRIGGQNKILMYNREVDDATLPDLSPQGVASSAPLPANQWVCFEYHLGPDGSIETWLNGNPISGLAVGPGVSNPNGGQWQRSSIKPRPTAVYFGWESYGGDSNTFWYDDIAIGSSRIGCESGGGSQPPASTTSPSSPSTTAGATTTFLTTTTPAPNEPTQTKYGQCGGNGYAGPTLCAPGSSCSKLNDWYSQCL